MYEDLFAYLEADLVGAQPPPPAKPCQPAEPARVLGWAAELVNADWSEEEAATELGQLATGDCLRAAYTMLLGSLMCNPLADVRGIRIARILLAALDGYRAPLPARALPIQRSGLLARLFRGSDHGSP